MKQQVVGTYYLGFESCQLVLREGDGGNAWFCPEKGSIPRMKIGADQNNWYAVMGDLLHEALEFSLTRAGCRYIPSQEECGSTDNVAFYCNHPQFTEAVARTAIFVSACQSDLHKAWKKWHKEKKGKKR